MITPCALIEPWMLMDGPVPKFELKPMSMVALPGRIYPIWRIALGRDL